MARDRWLGWPYPRWLLVVLLVLLLLLGAVAAIVTVRTGEGSWVGLFGYLVTTMVVYTLVSWRRRRRSR